MTFFGNKQCQTDLNNKKISDHLIEMFICHEEDLLEQYRTSRISGLTEKEAVKRLKEYGPNHITHEKLRPGTFNYCPALRIRLYSFFSDWLCFLI
ncbi:cation-transporting P-type ATPase [Paenibacillus larvae]